MPIAIADDLTFDRISSLNKNSSTPLLGIGRGLTVNERARQASNQKIATIFNRSRASKVFNP